MYLLLILAVLLLLAAGISPIRHAGRTRRFVTGFAQVYQQPIPFVFARHPIGTRNHEQNTRVVWVPTIADTDAPTVAELTAGTDITAYLTKDGLETPSDQNMVDNAGLDENFDAQGVGSFGGAIVIKAFRTDTDAAWNLFAYGTEGYIVVGRDSAGGIAATHVVEVYPAQMHQPVMMATAANERQKFTVRLAATAAPTLDAVVAA